jgi:hypothetical protein
MQFAVHSIWRRCRSAVPTNFLEYFLVVILFKLGLFLLLLVTARSQERSCSYYIYAPVQFNYFLPKELRQPDRLSTAIAITSFPILALSSAQFHCKLKTNLFSLHSLTPGRPAVILKM